MEQSGPARSRRRASTLVTGGAGFLGSHLAEHLLDQGHAVHVLDDLSAGTLDNLAHLQGRPGLRVTVGSAADETLAAAAVAEADCVFHLAGAVGVQRLVREPVAFLERNLRPTQVVLEAAASRSRPLLLASSSEVYGQGPVPFRETDPVRPGPTTAPRGGYACAKAMGEWLALARARESGLRVVVARIFNTVGPRQDPRHGMVLPRFVAQALAGEPITVYGDGRQTRCFAHVADTAAALAGLLLDPCAGAGVYNVGSDREIAIGELAELVRAAASSDSPIVHLPLADVFPGGIDDPPRRVPCLEQLRAALGWVPATPTERIVADLVAAFRRGNALRVPDAVSG